MVGGKAILPLQLNNLCIPDLDGGGNENIIEPEPEEITPESVIGRRPGMIRILVPEGIDQRFGIRHIPAVYAFQVSLALQKTNGNVFFPGIKIPRQDKGIRETPGLNKTG